MLCEFSTNTARSISSEGAEGEDESLLTFIWIVTGRVRRVESEEMGSEGWAFQQMGTGSVYVHSLGVDHAICRHSEHTDSISTGDALASGFLTVLVENEGSSEGEGECWAAACWKMTARVLGGRARGDGPDFVEASEERCAGGIETSDLVVESLDGGSQVHYLFHLLAHNNCQIPTLYTIPTLSPHVPAASHGVITDTDLVHSTASMIVCTRTPRSNLSSGNFYAAHYGVRDSQQHIDQQDL
ncbi:hypothetical protein NP233_g11418 [Leucocoprinus birnbaumii]|uniref:Uncharacterized protein n=1 Tax=Leucocoprinus birnbaumii TaxID=56174 RepID=A0AAD5VII8_9AGAR|nr:hypothetical protein NP233_g11418 [Leucocoprinus birnbaumii]